MAREGLPPVLLVWSRPTPGVAASGRDGIVRVLRDALSGSVDLMEHCYASSLDEVSGVRKIWVLLKVVFCALVTRTPLQVAMFGSRQQDKKLIEVIERSRPVVVYFDTVRCARAYRTVKAQFPSIRTVVDFDDLMSRRYEEQARYALRETLSLGYADAKVGYRIARILSKSRFLPMVLAREAFRLRSVESRTARGADNIVLLSNVEVAVLGSRLHESLRSRVLTIPPPFLERAEMSQGRLPFRFVFVGSDTLLQNALAIDYLVEMWRECRPRSELVIYGRQVRQRDATENVRFAGFEASYSNIYTESTISLAPAFIRGGIKTKVAEALAFGCPVVANEAAFEGFPPSMLQLAVFGDDTTMRRLVAEPGAFADQLYAASARAREDLLRTWSMEEFRRKWLCALQGKDVAGIANDVARGDD